MLAIMTKFLAFGRGNARGHLGPCIRAWAEDVSVMQEWDSTLNSEQNHARAAAALCHKRGWTGGWFMGELKAGEKVYVCVGTDADVFGPAFVIEPDGRSS